MTVDNVTPSKRNALGVSWQLPTLAAAGLTLLFALLALFFGTRLYTLQTHQLKAQTEAMQFEGVRILESESDLNQARVDREAAQQELKTEKTESDRLRRQLAAAMEDLRAAKTDLAEANKTITRLQSTLPEQSKPEADKTEPQPLAESVRSPETPLQPESPPPAQMEAQPASTQAPAESAPDTPAPHTAPASSADVPSSTVQEKTAD